MIAPRFTALFALACTSTSAPVDAGSDAADAGCAPPGFTCDGTKLLECTQLGSVLSTTCPLGCTTDAKGAHCKTFVPTGSLGGVDLDVATAHATLEGTRPYYFDTDTGHIEARESGKPSEELRPAGEGVKSGIGFFVFTQPKGPAIGAFTYEGMVIAKASSLHFIGTRVAGLVAAHNIHVDGWIFARPDCASDVLGAGGLLGSHSEGGTCGNTAPTTAACGVFSNPNGAGGGGGGNGTAGATGGDAYTDVGGTGGTPLGLLLGTSPFVIEAGGGGGGGGRLVSAPPDPARPCAGGAGGGAIHIVAQTSFVLTGGIDLGACGGRAAVSASPQCAGGGGGAGGTLFIESATVTIHPGATVVASGGGGAGASSLGATTSPGDAARSDATPANGGAGAGACNTIVGGSGGAGTSPPTAPAKCGADTTGWLGGGGGGAIGRFATKTMANGLTIDTTAIISPKNEVGTLSF